jgi:hypothetical protein
MQLLRLWIPGLASGHDPACRLSQVPLSLSRCALPTTTPGSRTIALACVFTARTGFSIFGRLAAPIVAFRGRNRFAFAAAHTVRFAVVRRYRRLPAPLHVSQAFHMVSSFQLTREPRIILTYRSAPRSAKLARTTASSRFLMNPDPEACQSFLFLLQRVCVGRKLKQ